MPPTTRSAKKRETHGATSPASPTISSLPTHAPENQNFHTELIDQAPYPFLHPRSKNREDAAAQQTVVVSGRLEGQVTTWASSQLHGELANTTIGATSTASILASSSIPMTSFAPPPLAATPSSIPTALIAFFLTRPPSVHLYNAVSILSHPERVVHLPSSRRVCVRCRAKGVECVVAPERKRCAYCASMRYACGVDEE